MYQGYRDYGPPIRAVDPDSPDWDNEDDPEDDDLEADADWLDDDEDDYRERPLFAAERTQEAIPELSADCPF